MKIILITVALIAMAAAELLPSKSYLPPPSDPSPGYPRGPDSIFNAAPEVIAARSLDKEDQEIKGNEFTRSSPQDQIHPRFGHDGNISHDQSSGSFRRNIDGDDDTVSLEADVSGFEGHASYHEAGGRSGYDPNSRSIYAGNQDNGFASVRGKNGGRSDGY